VSALPSPVTRVLIVDDEPLARRGIAQLVAAHADTEVVGECGDGREAITAIGTLSPDLVFLDVQMPERDGFDVVREIGPSRMPATIFLTAFSEFAVDAFSVEAVDYLVKPVSAERFEAAMARVRRWLKASQLLRDGTPEESKSPVSLLPRAEVEGVSSDRVIVPTSAGELVLSAREIDWIGAEDYYVAVHARGRSHLLRESLAALEERLDRARFARAHRGALVNLDRVREVRTSGESRFTAILRDGTAIPVSRRRWGIFTRALREWSAAVRADR
jgi:two-component system, LytTR family, response regulator